VVSSVVVASWEVSERRWRGSGGGGGGDGGETLRRSLSQGARWLGVVTSASLRYQVRYGTSYCT